MVVVVLAAYISSFKSFAHFLYQRLGFLISLSIYLSSIKDIFLYLKNNIRALTVWLSGLCVVLQGDRLPVLLLIRAYTWVQSLAKVCIRGNQSMFLSHIDVPLPLFLLALPSLKISK